MRALAIDDNPGTSVRYEELFRVPSLSVGRYQLPAGARDRQEPHTEDEIYVIRAGRAILRTPDGDARVTAGAVLFVPAGEEHRFVEIDEPLDVLVLFAPAEYSLSGART